MNHGPHAKHPATTVATEITPLNIAHQIAIVLPLPRYHVYPMSIALMSIALGANLRLVPNPRDTASVIDELKRAPFHMFMGVDTLFNSLVEDPRLQTVDFINTTSAVIGAGASVQQPVVERWSAASGAPITEAYGLTAYKVPRYVTFIESLPKSLAEKIQRKELRTAR